jgi:PAS domain S-box-containing protein
MRETLRVLVVEDNQADVDLIREALSDTKFVNFQIDSVSRLSEALARLKNTGIDLILLDLGLPDSQGLETYHKLREATSHIPVIILTGNDDQAMAIFAVRDGAQDYLVKGQFGGSSQLMRSVRYAVERKRAEEALRKSEEYFRAITENASDIILVVDKKGAITYASPSVEHILGYKPEELISKSSLDLIVPADYQRAIHDFGKAVLAKGALVPNAFRIRHKDGSERVLEGLGRNLYKDPSVAGFVMNVRDVTDNRKAERALRESEANYRQLFDNAPAGIYRVNFRTGKFLKANDFICEYLGCSQEEITSISPYDFITEESKKLLTERLNKMAMGEKVQGNPEYEIIDKNGTRRWLKLNVKNIYDSEGLAGADVVAHDITERKQSEEELRKSEDEFRSLAESMPQIVWVTRKDGWNIYFNQQWVDYTGLTLEESYGHGWNTPFHPDDRQRAWEAWQNATKNNGTYSLECRLRRADGVYRWWLVRGVPLLDETREIIKWFGTCTDIENIKHNEKKLLDTLESLRKAFGATIQAMVSAVETRDPYTSGHQLRSTDLARTIATEMGLPEEKIEGIRMAGSIHDIGKLSIPAEILSKPTKLTSIEFSIIKEHSLKGYEMLKDVESPWPLAEIVYQHHERMDGSGYPRNLKGEEILIEARILAVADVVEAMASHRPYRPGLGIDAALEEIEKNRGAHYDNAVADACLRLFREKGFKLEGIDYNP